MSKAAPRKAKFKDVTLPLYRAVERYVRAHGGSVLVAGGIQILQWPDEGKFAFTVGIKCTGKLPTFADNAEEKAR